MKEADHALGIGISRERRLEIVTKTAIATEVEIETASVTEIDDVPVQKGRRAETAAEVAIATKTKDEVAVEAKVAAVSPKIGTAL